MIRMLDKQGVQCVQGEADWRFAEGAEPPGWPKMDPIQRDRLMRLPQMLRFDLAGKTTVLDLQMIPRGRLWSKKCAWMCC